MSYEPPSVVQLGPVTRVVRGATTGLLDPDNKTHLN